MAFTSNLLLVATVTVLYLLTNTYGALAPDEDYCRPLDDSVARCTQDAIDFPDDTPWCPYHSCTAFGPADPCGPADKKATHKCKVEAVAVRQYECITMSGMPHKDILYPPGCENDRNVECEVKRVCPCGIVQIRREKYTAFEKANPDCAIGN